MSDISSPKETQNDVERAAAMTRKTASNKRATAVHILQMSTMCSRELHRDF
jgi:hypothetical protein